MISFIHHLTDIIKSQKIIINQQLSYQHHMPKLWLALFFGYEGTNYQGMQYQKQQNIKAIENQIVQRLKSRNLIATDNHSQLTKNYRWSRAARTDKGVHALINGISALFTISEQFYAEDQTLIRDKLTLEFRQVFEDSEIVFHCFKRVSTRFEMRQFIKSRKYAYICPKQMFRSSKFTTQQQILDKINNLCQIFIGSHNFHNYSRKIKAKDPEAMRFIINFSCASMNEKMFKFQIIGQSFIYHQIRKMIGSVTMIIANDYDQIFLENTFFRNQLKLPLAPAYGLYLASLSFDSYNKRTDIPERLTFQKQNQSINGLQRKIQSIITNIEISLWDQWYKTLKDENFKINQQNQSEGQHMDDA